MKSEKKNVCAGTRVWGGGRRGDGEEGSRRRGRGRAHAGAQGGGRRQVSKGFKADPEALTQAAKRAHEHADRIERHSRDLDSKTRGRVLGRGKLGQIVDKAVRP